VETVHSYSIENVENRNAYYPSIPRNPATDALVVARRLRLTVTLAIAPTATGFGFTKSGKSTNKHSGDESSIERNGGDASAAVDRDAENSTGDDGSQDVRTEAHPDAGSGSVSVSSVRAEAIVQCSWDGACHVHGVLWRSPYPIPLRPSPSPFFTPLAPALPVPAHSYAPDAPVGLGTLRVMNANIWNYNQWPARRPLLTQEFSRWLPDVVLLQEVRGRHTGFLRWRYHQAPALADDFARVVGGPVGFVSTATAQFDDAHPEEEGVAILSRLPILDYGWLVLSSKGSIHSDGMPRRVIWAHVALPSGDTVIVATVHLTLTAHARARHYVEIGQWCEDLRAAKGGVPLLLSGDFNEILSRLPVHPFFSRGFVDAAQQVYDDEDDAREAAASAAAAAGDGALAGTVGASAESESLTATANTKSGDGDSNTAAAAPVAAVAGSDAAKAKKKRRQTPFTFPTDAPRKLIDHIFIHGPAHAVAYSIAGDKMTGTIFPSDHLFNVADIDVGKAEGVKEGGYGAGIPRWPRPSAATAAGGAGGGHGAGASEGKEEEEVGDSKLDEL